MNEASDERLAKIEKRYEQFRRGGVDEAIVFANQAQNDIPYLLERVEQLEKAEYARDQLRALISEALEGKDAELFRQLEAVTAERDRLLLVIELVADPENYNGSYRLPASLRSMAQQALAQKG